MAGSSLDSAQWSGARPSPASRSTGRRPRGAVRPRMPVPERPRCAALTASAAAGRDRVTQLVWRGKQGAIPEHRHAPHGSGLRVFSRPAGNGAGYTTLRAWLRSR